MSALNKKSFLTYLKEGGIYVVLLVLLAIIIFQDPTFLSLLNLSNILTQSSVRIIIALGVAGLIVTQGTDLSAGRQVGLAAVIAATMLQAVDNANKVFPDMATMPIPLVILLVCAIGAVIGLINGIVIAYLNVTPFITTLGTMIIVYGINSLYYDFVGASPISGFEGHLHASHHGAVAHIAAIDVKMLHTSAGAAAFGRGDQTGDAVHALLIFQLNEVPAELPAQHRIGCTAQLAVAGRLSEGYYR